MRTARSTPSSERRTAASRRSSTTTTPATEDRPTTPIRARAAWRSGRTFRKTLFALKFKEGNLLLSDLVNSNSKILWDRTPKERVAKAAPWLRVDGDPYSAVVDGRIVWILDGYTTSDGYPYSQRTSLGERHPGHLHAEHHSEQRRGAAPGDRQLCPQLGQGRGRRLRRHRHPVRVGPRGPGPQGVGEVLPRFGEAQGVHQPDADGAPALSRGPVQDPARHPVALPRDHCQRLLRRSGLLGGPAGPHGRRQHPAAAAALLRPGADAGSVSSRVLADDDVDSATTQPGCCLHRGEQRRRERTTARSA